MHTYYMLKTVSCFGTEKDEEHIMQRVNEKE